ncbi:MAG TPA: DinB family protein [Chitinophagaceae bacterium]|nr:DinB family protein [Chitinophagaceae bacterium]
MKEILQQLAAYNFWANQRMFETILVLTEEKQKSELPSSFKSIYDTVLHMWNAESVWWQRMKLQERISAPSEYFKGSMQELTNELLQENRQWIEWIDAASEAALDHVFQYQTSKKEQFKQPISQMLIHVFNHGTYHRGQLVNMLRQLAIEKIPQTDFIVWSRMKR